MYFLCFQYEPTRTILYPVLASCGYPYQYQNHPEKLLERYTMPDLISGFFAPFVVRVPCFEDIQQSPVLETLWLLLHQKEDNLTISSSLSPTCTQVHFTSYQEQVHQIQQLFNREYTALLQTKWMDSYQWNKFQVYRPEEVDLAERVQSFLRVKSSSWTSEILDPLQPLFAQFDNQSISHGQFAVIAKRTLAKILANHQNVSALRHLPSYWKECQQDMNIWLDSWNSTNSSASASSSSTEPTEPRSFSTSLRCLENGFQKEGQDPVILMTAPSIAAAAAAEREMKQAAATWWNDSSSVFVYSWRGGTREIVQHMVSRYLKSMYLFSVVAFAARNQQSGALLSKFG